MITLTFQFDSVEEAMSALAGFSGKSQAVVVDTPPPAAPATETVAAAVAAVAPPPATPPAAAVAPPPATNAAAAVAQIDPRELAGIMQEKSAKLQDGGAACQAILVEAGVSGLLQATQEQLVAVKAKVEAL
jgi:hypothetical protein